MSSASLTRWFVLIARLAVALLLGLALWNPGWRSTLSPMNVIIVLDESGSMGPNRPASAWRTIATALTQLPPSSHYNLIRFGAEPVLEAVQQPIKELDAPLTLPRKGLVDATGTNLEAALRLAGRQLDGETPSLMVLATDAGETTGNAAALLTHFPELGLPQPFILFESPDITGPDAAITTLDAPSNAPFGAEISVVINVSSNRDALAEIKLWKFSELAATIKVDLFKYRLSRIRVPLMLNAPGPQELEITVSMPGDINSANDGRRFIVNVDGPTSIVYVTAKPRTAFADSLLAGGWNLNIVRPEHFPRILPRLPNPATVVLDNVAIGDMPGTVWLDLTESVRAQGTGLIVLGGQRSFGAGGYLNSTLEAALPVTSEAAAPMSRAAVMFVVDKSGSMGRGPSDVTPFGLAKAAVLEATSLLGENDYSGIIAFDIEPQTWLSLADHKDPVTSVKNAWLGTASGGTRISPALLAASGRLAAVSADQHLLLLVTDGFAVEDDYSEVLARIDEHKIDVIALAIGHEPAIDFLEKLTSKNDGLLLRVSDVAMLPSLASEAVGSRRLTYDSSVTQPRQERELAFLSDHGKPWPILDGYMVTKERLNSRVYLRSERGDPLMADHDHGLGRVVVLPGGLGTYAGSWPDWSAWPPFTGGLVEWASNRFGDDLLFIRIVGGSTFPQIEIDALSTDGDWEILGAARVSLRDPFGRITALNAPAVAPGKYQAELPVRQTGHHRVTVQLGGFSRPHDFFYEAPAEQRAAERADQTIKDWLAKGLVKPWPAGESIQTLATVTVRQTRSFFILLATLLYLGILVTRHAYAFRSRRHRRSAFRPTS